MLRTAIIALCVIMHLYVFSQDIGGVVNKYYKVTAVNTTAHFVTVTNPKDLAPLDKVMLIQLKGADINVTNSSNFGTITNLNNAGNYELATICKIEGNDVYFINTISKAYTPSGKVQLVKIPRYNDANVTTQLEAAPWDNTAGTGGILAISVLGTLTLNANISADGKGFKGGQFIKSVNEPQFCFFLERAGYVYDPTIADPQKGAAKGESVADIAVSISGGRAAVANGGGGGNNHNNGGGGGCNLSAGGIGGGSESTNGCPGSYPGAGGKALSNVSNTKIYLGGGGGAGHANNYTVVGGGNGGGIIFIEAGSIISNGYKIIANGEEGSYTIGDGASGGGAGGTIILNVNSYSGQPTIEAKGGKGGDEEENENDLGRCFGEGGGGSGGAIYFKNTQPTGTIITAGGIKGTRLHTQCTTGSLAGNGGAGTIISGYSISQSATLSSSCTENISLPVILISFKAFSQNKKVALEWEVTDPQDADHYTIQRKGTAEDWKEITTIKGDAKAAVYQSTDATVAEGDYMYRLKIIEKDGNIIYSPVRYVSFNNQSARLAIYPNPVTSMQDVTLQYNFKAGDVIKMFDAAGRLVLQKQLKKNEAVVNLNLSGLQKGMYMIVAANATGRIMVQ